MDQALFGGQKITIKGRCYLLMQALVGDDAALVDGIHFNSRLKYMLVRLRKGTTREQLEAIQPDFINLTAAVGKDRMSMAILTAECLTGQILSLC